MSPGPRAAPARSQHSRTSESATAPDADLVRTYLREIGRFPLLGAEQEVALAKAVESGVRAAARLVKNAKRLSANDTSKLQAQIDQGDTARRAFVEANLRLVVSIARRYQGFGLPLLDLIQDGNIGLLRAVEKFDWRRGFKFSTYATWWIRQGISRGIADRARTIRLPVHIAELVNRLRVVESDLSRELGREPSDEELAAALGAEVDQMRTWRIIALDTVSLSTPLGEDGDSELHDFIEDDNAEGPLEEAVRARTADELRAVLDTLGPRERRILELRFGFVDGRPKTLEEIGKEFALTRERIRQIEAKGLAKLRHPARHTNLREFLD